MSEYPIAISTLNDFIFCPVSIYFHGMDTGTEKMLYQSEYQINGTAAHTGCDNGEYSDHRSVLQGADVYSEEYDLVGKIDVFDVKIGRLTERKKKIKVIYDGYVYQIYGQCLALREMGYAVRSLRLYSMEDNKSYPIPLPEDDPDRFAAFRALLQRMRAFSINRFSAPSPQKCAHCIYEPLCCYAVKE